MSTDSLALWVEANYVSDLLALLHHFDGKSRLTAMLNAYTDESVDETESKFYVISAWMAAGDDWAKLTPAWREVLRRYKIPTKKNDQYPEFHACDFNQHNWPFRHLDVVESSQLLDELLALIDDLPGAGFAVAINIKECLEILGFHTNQTIKRKRLLYFFCFLECLKMFLAQYPGLPDEEQIGVVYDRKDKVRGEIIRMEDALYEAMRTLPYFRRFAVINPGNSVEHVGLQIADLLAYEHQRFLTNYVNGKYEERKPYRFLRARSVHTKFYAGQEVIDLAKDYCRDKLLHKTLCALVGDLTTRRKDNIHHV